MPKIASGQTGQKPIHFDSSPPTIFTRTSITSVLQHQQQYINHPPQYSGAILLPVVALFWYANRLEMRPTDYRTNRLIFKRCTLSLAALFFGG
jgi:hypothetical protein